MNKANKMYKVVIALLITMSVYAYGFAAERPGFVESKIFKGKVDSIILPDPVNGVKHQIVVNGDSGRMKFFLTSGIGVFNKDLEVLSLKKIQPGDKVTVEYTPAKGGGIHRAISVIIE
ncbi:MAG TPA: hypothetical protein PL125_05090 [Candidatus Omnitrophota bacterium]|nr:hypothetical protein [Candidatus Omnitrophota bacterium]HPT39552.1 hypothetical protein [Candidatus Omnitrophota bacterium]